MSKNNKVSNYIFIIYGIIIFFALFFFFTKINPLTVYDADDWLYIGQFRIPLPMVGAWNPTRVFPETFMPLVSSFGAFFINPIIHNYYFSLTIAHSILGSILITFYFVEFSLLLYKKKLASVHLSIGIGILFILLHFFAFTHSGNNNYYLLWSLNLTCFYYYTLSAIINASLVMHCMSNGGLQALFVVSNLPKKILLFIWIYFAINSNLFSSVIMAAYIGTELLLVLMSEIKNQNFDLKKYCKANWLSLIVIISWFIANILETTGGRADSIGKSIIGTIPFTILLAILNTFIVNIFITIFGITVGIIWIKQQRATNPAVQKFILYITLSIVYLLFLCSSSDPTYIMKPDVFIVVLFYVYLALMACFCELLSTSRKYARLLLILAGTILLVFIHPGKFYVSYNYSNLSYKQCEELTNDLISQCQNADSENETALLVPHFDYDGNWPFSDYIGERIAYTLNKHHVIHSQLNIKETIPTKDKNQQFNIPEYDFPTKNVKSYLIYLYISEKLGIYTV
ncbi:hypothetical protein SAMN04487770_11640 [Butyrivibrio sp. ob235]|uniref:hypothetical protein n=1 Tax=Butyrivibrio sp. ob235 TaxID=1761780 RepID=UPI0008C026C2|nr:hypothetical protein [Butyrivibrio sp. ob235]SEL73909.1 hypothetical protein SAMN04487770_11640 [Butyrivibrio sp. ob235]